MFGVFRREHKRENMFGIWLAFLVMMDGDDIEGE